MSNLVFLEPNCVKAVPFTTSDVIAEYAKIKHHAVQQMISKHEESLKKFGLVAFEMRANNTVRGIREEKIYHLNEEQATLLITFLRNTEPVINFKVELVRQFYQMRTELQMRHLERERLKPIRREMTDVINDDPEHNKWDFKLYTDLIYKIVTGKNAAQIRKERGASRKAKAIEYMTSGEMEQIAKLTNKIGVLLELGNDYYTIKDILTRKYLKSA